MAVLQMMVRRGLPVLCLLLSFLILISAESLATEEESEETFKKYDAERVLKQGDKMKWLTASHRKHEALQQAFTSGPEVTAACLSCHNEAGEQMMETIHWTWRCPADPTGKMGKAGLTLNNF
jgi:hypothetical protein